MSAASSLTDLSVSDFLDRLASGDPTPGGGSAGALGGALAAALTSMVCNLTLGRSEFESVAPEVEQLLAESEAVRGGLMYGVEADAIAFGHVATAYRLPRGDEAQKSARLAAIGKASVGAAREPLEVARLCARALDVATRLAEIGNPRVLSDVAVAAHLALASLHSAAANVEVNLPSIGEDPFAAEARHELDHLLEGRRAQVDVILARVKHRTA